MKYTFIRYAIYALITFGLMELMRYDASSTTQIVKFAESSLVEQFQNILLGLSLIILFITPRFKGVKYILILIIGLFFIREQDAFLDTATGEHSWKYFCIAYSIIIGYILYKNRKSIFPDVEKFMTSASSGILFLGFTTLLIFSRMFGRKKFWIAIENTENYTRNIKNAAEESTELYAYFLLFIGIIEFYFYAKKSLIKHSI